MGALISCAVIQNAKARELGLHFMKGQMDVDEGFLEVKH